MSDDDEDISRFGHTKLPMEQEAALSKARKLEWITIGYYIIDATLLYLVMGSSQAMKTAWTQDLLALLPPIAFLIAVRVAGRRPTGRHPYGFHRSVGIAHLVAAFALCAVGAYLIGDSILGLTSRTHPTIGGIELFGQTFWLGWLMIGVLLLTSWPPVLLGRAKMKLAKKLHDKVLYADADMNRADWMTTIAAIVGVLGIGLGFWWTDSVAAILISLDILRDGARNLRIATTSLMDTRARTYDGSGPDPLNNRIDQYLRSVDWMAEAKSRIRDEGHVYHVESFVVPKDNRMPSLGDVEWVRKRCIELDWKIEDMVIIPVAKLPDEFLPDVETSRHNGNSLSRLLRSLKEIRFRAGGE